MSETPYKIGLRCTLTAVLLLVAGLAGGCGQTVEPGRTHHRLYAWSCPRAEGGKAYLVLRYQDKWTDARKSSRVGLIKFRTEPAPAIFDDRYVWGVPTGGEQFVLFDASRNRTVLRPDYVRRGDGGGAVTACGQTGAETELLAFATSRGAVEVVRPDGTVVVPAEAGYVEARPLNPEGQSGRLALIRADGRWDLVEASSGSPVEVGPVLTALENGLLVAF